MSSIREHLEAIRDRHTDSPWCTLCGQRGPCPDFVDAVAALATLDACVLDEFWDNDSPNTSSNPLQIRLVPDASLSARGDEQPAKENT